MPASIKSVCNTSICVAFLLKGADVAIYQGVKQSRKV